MPSGKPKTMAVDLTGKFLSASREVRIVTNLCVYWDEIYLLESSAPPVTRLTTALHASRPICTFADSRKPPFTRNASSRSGSTIRP